MTSYDVIIIGAGPAGLTLARSLGTEHLNVLVIERAHEETIANPAPDGRQIALTHYSAQLMRSLGMWQQIPREAFSAIKQARVMNGTSSYYLKFDASNTSKDKLAAIVSNHQIRSAAYKVAIQCDSVTMLYDAVVESVRNQGGSQQVTLADGQTFKAPLVVAADSRFSEMRKRAGIGASMHDFGKTMILCDMEQELPHDDIAHECFHYGHTLAILPLVGKQVSAVVTVRTNEADALLAMPEADFASWVTKAFEAKKGAMRVVGKRYSYPLVGVYAERFVAPRLALIGDAAVGMHPVTAHGLNFGLSGQHALAQEILSAFRAGLDIGGMGVLENYERIHRRATRPLYLATNGIVTLFTRDTPPAKMLRGALLHIANRMMPIKQVLTAKLTQLPPAA